MKTSKLGLLAAFVAALVVAGCEREGPAEETGEEVGRSLDEAGEAVREGTNGGRD